MSHGVQSISAARACQTCSRSCSVGKSADATCCRLTSVVALTTGTKVRNGSQRNVRSFSVVQLAVVQNLFRDFIFSNPLWTFVTFVSVV